MGRSQREDSVVSKSLVIPVYRNEGNLPDLFEALRGLSANLNHDLEVIFVVDGSPDDSYAILQTSLHGLPFRTKLISHSRNFGSFAAIISGFKVAQGENLAVMSADLQEPVGLIEEFFRILEGEPIDVVVGARQQRQDPIATRWSSEIFWSLFRALVQPELPRGGVDVFGCTREVAQILVALPEANSSLVGLLYWIGFSRREVPYIREKRLIGRSSWSLVRKLKYLSDSIFSFTYLPIAIILFVGVAGFFGSLVFAGFVLFAWVSGAIAEPGYTTLVLVQLTSTGALLVALGIVGTYVWRTFENSKERPNAIIRQDKPL